MAEDPKPARVLLLQGATRAGYWYLRVVEPDGGKAYRLSCLTPGMPEAEIKDFPTAEAAVGAFAARLNDQFSTAWSKYLLARDAVLQGNIPHRAKGFRPGKARSMAMAELRTFSARFPTYDKHADHINTELKKLGWPPMTGLVRPWAV